MMHLYWHGQRKRLQISWGIYLTMMCWLVSTPWLNGQNFPITSLVQVTDFSPRIEAYDDPGRTIITLINIDERPEYEALLRINLSGPGFSIRTREDYMPFPLILRRNQPLILTGAQLRDYFDPANLVFEGISFEEVLSNGGLLPEGPVSLCVEVFDFQRFFDPAVSNRACATGFMLLHRPPILIEPIGEIPAPYPQQVRFLWQPQHAGVAVRYTLEVYEDILPGMGDNLIIESTQPLLFTQGLPPFYQLTPADPPFTVGSRYLVRVRAEDVMGRAAFLNDGWSDIYSFTYGGSGSDDEESCIPATTFAGEATGPSSVALNWSMDVPGYVLNWVLSTEGGEEIELAADNFTYIWEDLPPAEVQNFTLCAICKVSSSCETISIIMPPDTSDQNECGYVPMVSWYPIDDDRITVNWANTEAVDGWVLKWGQVPISLAPAQEAAPIRGDGETPRGRSQRSPRERGGLVPGNERAVGRLNPAFSFTDSISLSAATQSYELGELGMNRQYRAELCKLCPEGGRLCSTFDFTFEGLDDDCLTGLDFTRLDSTETSLSLGWNMNGEDYSSDSTFWLIWQLADGSMVADSAQLDYPSGNYTISDLLPYRTYEIQVCTECTAGQPVCIPLDPYGGCPSAFEPYLVDLASDQALIAWDISQGDSLRLTEARIKPRASWRWDSLPVGQSTYFNPSDFNLDVDQTAETNTLRSAISYLVQIKTQCTDSVWSEWSEPVRFSTQCAVVDSLWLADVSKESAIVSGMAKPNAAYYIFEYRLKGAQSWNTADNLPQPSLELLALESETEYEVRMRYWCNRGVWSDYTDIFTFQTLPPCDPPSRLIVDSILVDAARINWSPYLLSEQVEVRYRPNLAGFYYYYGYPLPWQTEIEVDSSIFLSDLSGGARYDYQLRTDCGVNYSEWTELANFELKCAPPEQIEIEDITYESAVVRLTGLPPAATSSRLEYRMVGDSSWSPRNVLYGVTALSGLDDMTYYEVRAKSSCYTGEESDYSDTVQFRTPVKCLIPDMLAASEIEPFSAQIDWAVTGTVDEWEILVKGPIGSNLQLEQLLEGAPESVTEVGGGNQPVSLANPGNGTPPTPTSGRNLGLGSGAISLNPPAARAMPALGFPGSMQAPQFVGWHRFTVTDPSKFLEELKQNTDYEVVVRARCPEYGWTDYSDTLLFKTLKDCRIPINLATTEIYRSSLRPSWQSANGNSEEYMVAIESVYPLPAIVQPGAEEAISVPRGEGSGGFSPLPGGRQQMRRLDWYDHLPTFDNFYRDSIQTPDLNATFTGLRSNTLYRWRVKTRCDNYGWTDYSEWVIVRTDECGRPEDIMEEPLDRSTMMISWTPTYGLNDYEFRYKLFDTPGADWLTVMTNDSFVILENLLSNQIYDYQIAELCQGSEAMIPAIPDSFLMRRPSLNNGLYVCGMETQVDLSNQVPLSNLVVDDTIVAFDFPIVITSASGGGGYFSGTGDIKMPYFNKAKFSFTFDNIFVNDEYRMVGGYLEATGFGIEVLPPWADSLLSDILEVLEIADDILEQELNEQLDELLMLGENAGLPPDLQQGIADVADCFEQAQGSSEIDSCASMADSVLALVEDWLEDRYEGDFQVVFGPADNQQYGFDGRGTSDPASFYTSREIAGSNYTIPYKSVRENLPETVDGFVQSPGIPDSVTYNQTSGVPLPTSQQGAATRVSFIPPGSDPYYLVAEQVTGDTSANFIAGLLNVVPYPNLPLKVALVPLSGTAASGLSATNLEQGLREIFSQAVVSPDVSILPPFTASGYDGTLDAVGSGILTNYSPEMRDIINAFEGIPQGIDDDTYYLFLTDSYEPVNRAGFMPRGRQFGFLYMGNAGSGENFVRTLAHELGHGAYVLEHTFEAYPNDLPEGQTDNLMDYNNGTRLYKWQWDLIHDPVGAPLLPSDSTGQSNTLTQLAFLDSFRNENRTLTFMSPAGKPITVPENVEEVSFNTGDNIAVGDSCFSGYAIYPFGSLRSFATDDGKFFNTYLNCNNTGNFYAYGYSSSSGEVDSFYIDSLSKGLGVADRKVIYIVPQSQNNALGWVAKQATWEDIGFEEDDLDELDTAYGGQGARKKFDFIVSELSGIGGGRVVPLQNDDYFTDPAEQLLAVSAAWGGTSESALVYAYTHAHQMSRYPLVTVSCNPTLLTGVNYLELQLELHGMYEQIEVENQTNPYAIVTDDPALVISKEEIENWQNADASIYKHYSELYQQVVASRAVLDYPPTEEGANELIKLLKFWENNPCAIGDLSLAERLHILNILRYGSVNADWLWGLMGEEHQGLYNSILSATQPQEYQDVIDLYSANGFELFEDIHAKFDAIAYDFFVGTLSNMVIQSRSFETSGLPIRNQAFNQNGSISTHYTIGITGQNPSFSGVSVIHPVDAFVDEPGDYFESFLGNADNEFRIAIQTGVLPQTRQIQRTVGTPFSPVALKFLHDVTFGENSPSPIDVSAGTTLVLPLCLAELLYRNYRDADWNRNFKAFITVVAIAGAAASIVFSGGTATGVVFAVLATADAVAATAVYSLSDDAYSWETTGQGSIDQSIHQTVNNISMIVGVTNILGLVGYGGGQLIFNFNKIKAAVLQLRQTAPAKLANFKAELKELYRLIRQYGLSGIPDPNLVRLEQQLRAEIYALYLNEAIEFSASSTSLHLQPNLYAVAINNGMEIPLGTGEIINDLYRLRPGLWLPSRPATGKVLEISNINYVDELGNPQFGKLTFYEDATSPSTWRCFAEIIFVPYADDFPEFFTLFQQKGWNWGQYFTAEARGYIQSLNASERLALKNAISNWPDGTYPIEFSRIFDDLALNLYPTGLTNTVVGSVVNKVTTSGLRDAIEEAIKYTADPDLILLKGQFEGLMTEWHRGVLSYSDFSIARNQIRATLIDALPASAIMGTGGLPGSTPSIVNKIVNNQLSQAIDDVIQFNNLDANLQRAAINLRGRANDLLSDWNLGIISYETRTVQRNQIRFAVIDGLGIVGNPNVPANLAESIRLKVIGGNIRGALDDAFNATGNPIYTAMKGRYEDLLADQNLGIISYEQWTINRNKIRFHLVTELPLAATGSGGLTPPVISNIQATVASGQLRQAMGEAVLYTTELSRYDELMHFIGRYEDLASDWSGPIMSYEDYTINLNRIRANFNDWLTQ
ncbi:MAG: hypothetical protein AAGF87_04085 [Bacteroidota bacterium]